MSEMTIKELARICGVAVSTVSRAMNDRADVNPATRARIRAAAEEHGYVPNASARHLKIGSTRTIAVFIQGEMGQMLIETLQCLETDFAAAGYDTTLSHIADKQTDHAGTVERIVRQGKFTGVVFLGRYGNADPESSAQLSRRLAEIDVPMVFCTTPDYSGSAAEHASISVDDLAGGRDLTEHLLARGHRRIGFIGAGVEHDGDHPWALRLTGYNRALETAGVAVDATLVVPSVIGAEPYSMRNGYESTREWLAARPADAEPVTAFVGVCDAVAVGAARAFREAGLVIPDDVSLVGFDGLDLAEFHNPQLTTIAQPIAEIAQSSARVLLATIDDPDRAVEQVWIRGRLIEGASVASLPQD